MLVKAKCTSRAWDSGAAVLCYPGEVYEIEHDGKLAALKIGNSWVFEFDRTMAGTGVGPTVGGYICKECQATFKSVNELGTHTRQEHREKARTEVLDDDEPIVIKKEKPWMKGRTFTCKTCAEVLPNLYALRVHNKSHQQQDETAETLAVPA